ncbi:B3/4 domain-containing protein [Candidatus Tisiphia endosymbiont of Oplodontha viridula]|uniref:B3/B4 domain-containing protein n=1 Tax=Candidatus Tisiphia endosymbiont of Oplodontha viridula TaxID=3077925 RepID=UPI0035C8C8B0
MNPYVKCYSSKSQRKHDPKTISELIPIKALRDAYKNLGVKVSSYLGSNEALLKRILSDKGLYQINTVVDINNYVSITSLRSVGSYDLSKLSGDIEFRPGKSGETYIGTTNRAINLEHLPVLCDRDGPFGSPTSDSSKALIQDSTTDIITVIFSFDGDRLLKEQMHEMTRLLIQYAGATNVHTYSIKDGFQELLL